MNESSDAGRREPAGNLRRHATADPNRFLIPTSDIPRGFAANLESGAARPVEPRTAATVVIARDTVRGPEVLLMKRHGASGFAAGAWVFPGGLVDAADSAPGIVARVRGPSPAAWGSRMAIPDPGIAIGHVVAAIREAWEEAGILLAASREPRVTPADLAERREELLAGHTSFEEVLTRANLELRGDALAYVAHWITPEPETRRYDTRFFLAPAAAGMTAPEEGSEVRFQPSELVEACWLAPAAAVRRFEAGELRMLPPTVHTLRRLQEFRTVAEMTAALAHAPVETILPRMKRSEDGLVIEVSPTAHGGDR